VERTQDQVAGQRCLHSDLSRLHVADFSNHDFIRIVPQDGPQHVGERYADIRI
jgi:hypothetical protein